MKRPEMAAHTFVFSNVGTAMLEITDVQASCSCTTVGEWDRRVAPGQAGRISIQLASATLSGPVVRTITVSSNDPLQPTSLLRLSATVPTSVEVDRSAVIFQFVGEGAKPETKIVRIVNRQPAPLMVEGPRSTNPAFTAELRIVNPGQEFELNITTVPPPIGNTISSVISMTTSSPDMPLITVQAYAVTRLPVVVSPPQIDLPAAPLAGGVNVSVSITGAASDSLVLSDPTLGFVGATVQLREVQPGRLFHLNLAFPAGFALPKNAAAEVTVKSNNPMLPLIRIPITQNSRSDR